MNQDDRRHRHDVVAAVDVGGTRIKAALVDRSLTVLAATVTATPAGLADTLPGTVAGIIQGLLADSPASRARPVLTGCGIVVPGLVDQEAGVGVLSVNLGWRDLPIAAPLAELLGVPVTLGHDVRAGLYAEMQHGHAAAARHALFLPLGTGIAGALMVDRRILDADGWAGELGHLPIDAAGPVCRCGARGCLETISSATAIQRNYAQHTGRSLGGADIARLVDQRDPAATTVWDTAVQALAHVIITTTQIAGIDLVIIGGGLSECGPTLTTPLDAAITNTTGFHRPVKLVRAHFGDRAASIGAAILAWDAA